MSTPGENPTRVAGFRTKLVMAMMLIVSAATLVTLVFVQRRVTDTVEAEYQSQFQAELDGLERTQQMRHGALLERCRALVRRPRIQQSLEEALDLLYLNAFDELRDLTAPSAAVEPVTGALHAQFYRFLDRQGVVISPVQLRSEGVLTPEEEARLALPQITTRPQIGYLPRRSGGVQRVSEIIAMPIISSESNEPVGALVLGFQPFEFTARPGGMNNAIWLEGQLFAGNLPESLRGAITREAARGAAEPVAIDTGGGPNILFSKRLNPDSQYPAAFEVCVFPARDLARRQTRLRWQVLTAGCLVLLLALAASHWLAGRLSATVEQLAVDSEENRTLRRRAETALEMTHAELQRSARFSADASHQLKTPVTVLRAGLEELLAREKLTPAECDEISALIHQTYRLSSLIEDLLLLSRMDAGRLKLDVTAVDLNQLLEASLDDLSALPDDRGVELETDFPPDLQVLGEKRYTAIILQNLLENARKYNRPGGRIRVAARIEGGTVRLSIANTGQPISAAAQSHIFERFHRGAIGENVPGYGLGLNLARELARLHLGDLRLVRSDEQRTEFEVQFQLAHARIPVGGMT